MRKPKIAVILPVFNAGSILGATISSILAQDYEDFRLYVINDGSTDDTRAQLSKLDRVRNVHVIHQENKGQAAALNAGIAAGKEPLIALCDADDLWRNNRLSRTVQALHDYKEASFVCSDFCRGVDHLMDWQSAWRVFGYSPTSKNAFEDLLAENFVCRSTVLLRRSHIKELGGFSVEIGGKCGSDDRDMWLRLTWRYGPANRLNEVLVWKRESENQDSKSLRAVESRVRLWNEWVLRLQGEPVRRRIARRNMIDATRHLAWRLRCERRYLESLRQSLRLFMHTSSYRHIPVDLAKIVGCQLLRNLYPK